MAIELSALTTLLAAGADGATIFHRVLTPVARLFKRPQADALSLSAQRRRFWPPKTPYELVPLWFEVDLLASLPEVRVQLVLSNHLDKPLQLSKVHVRYLRLDSVITFEKLESDDYELAPMHNHTIWCRRQITDAELRMIGNSTRREPYYEGAIHLRGVASSRGKPLEDYFADSQQVHGVIRGQPTL